VTDEVEDLLRDDAKREGLSFNQYCHKYGIVGPAQRLQIKRHEVPLEGKAS